MRIYIDCSNGISTDRVLNALIDLGASEKEIAEQVELLGKFPLHRGYMEIKKLIEEAGLKKNVLHIAIATYEAIAKAEAEVHGETLETVHFHEVGRDEAIRNIVSVAAALSALNITEIYCSDIHDGHGTITCSHGEIPVPVPAVVAMKKQCNYYFVQDDIDAEMVTPSGLAMLIGMDAYRVGTMSIGVIVKTGIGKGTRDIGRNGLKIHVLG